MKKCSKCKEEKDLSQFDKQNEKKCKLRSSCKTCNKEWFLENKDKIKEYKREYYLRTKERDKAKKEDYYEKHKKEINSYKVTWQKKREDNDPVFKLKRRLNNLIWQSFKRRNKYFYKSISSEHILGCSTDFFIQYISNKFTEGMTLDNHGEWHIDHITPVSIAKTEEDLIKLCHYTNLQPLWAVDNLKKGNKY